VKIIVKGSQFERHVASTVAKSWRAGFFSTIISGHAPHTATRVVHSKTGLKKVIRTGLCRSKRRLAASERGGQICGADGVRVGGGGAARARAFASARRGSGFVGELYQR
jgi:hypothetical protein